MTREPVPVALSWSGGKDSSLALHTLRSSGEFHVVALLTSVTSGYDRISIHGVRRELLLQQARSLGLPLITVMLEPASSNDAYEAAFHCALHELTIRFPDVQHIAFGDLYLTDVRDYRERLLAGTRFTGVYPVWGEPTKALAERFVHLGFEATLVCVDNTQLDGSFAGRSFDRSLLADLPATADPCGENGEFHTFVSAGPIFTTPVAVTRGEVVVRDGRFTYCDLTPV